MKTLIIVGIRGGHKEVTKVLRVRADTKDGWTVEWGSGKSKKIGHLSVSGKLSTMPGTRFITVLTDCYIKSVNYGDGDAPHL